MLSLTVSFQTKIMYDFLSFPISVTCPAHLNLIHVITLTIFGETWSHDAPHYAVLLEFKNISI